MIGTTLDDLDIIAIASGIIPTRVFVGEHEFWRVGRSNEGSWYLRLVADGSIWTTNEFGGLVPIRDPRRGTQDDA